MYTAADGSETRELVQKFDGPGIAQGMHNLDASIESFARSCFEYALDIKQDIWFATKDTISKKYDHRFKDIFQDIYDAEYAARFEEAGIEYFYTLIDDAVARVMKADGGFIWACKNYDGDRNFSPKWVSEAKVAFGRQPISCYIALRILGTPPST